jgi:hypothetical protein
LFRHSGPNFAAISHSFRFSTMLNLILTIFQFNWRHFFMEISK